MYRSPEQLASLLRSPQFRRQLHAFHSAFASGQLDMRLFGLNPQVRRGLLFALCEHQPIR